MQSFYALLAQNLFSVGFFGFAGLRQTRHDGKAVADERPVGGIDAVLAVFWWINFDDFDIGLLETVDEGGVLALGVFEINGSLGIIWVDFEIVGEKICA